MTYLVVGCPKCGGVRVAAKGPETSSCPSCGRRFRIAAAKIHFESATQEQARSAAAFVRAGDSDALAGASTKPVRRDGKASAGIDIARSLCEARGTFTEDDFSEAAESQGIRNGRRLLAAMLAGADVYESAPGRYRTVARR